MLKQQAIWLINKPSVLKTLTCLVRHGIPFDAISELVKVQLTNFNLAVNFNNRININLREDKGFTYGAGSYFNVRVQKDVLIYETPS